MMYRRGPRTELCGRPYGAGTHGDPRRPNRAVDYTERILMKELAYKIKKITRHPKRNMQLHKKNIVVYSIKRGADVEKSQQCQLSSVNSSINVRKKPEQLSFGRVEFYEAGLA